MRQPRYQYHLYGALGEFRGVTTSLAEATAHKRLAPGVYSYRRYAYDQSDADWQHAKERGLICIDGGLR